MENIKSKKIFANFLKVLALIFIALLAFSLPMGCGKDNGGSGGGGGDDDYVDPDLGPIPASGVRIKFHYFRDDGNYKDCNMWIWSPQAEGTRNDFAGLQTIGGKKWAVLTITINNATAGSEGYAGFIVRRGDGWDKKDVDADRWVPASAFTDQFANVYLITGDEAIYYSKEEGISAMENIGKPKFKYARFTNYKQVFVSTNTKISEKSHFKVKDASGNVLVELDCNNSNAVGKTFATIPIPSGKTIDISQQYTISDEPANFDASVNFMSKTVSMTNLYETEEFVDAYGYDGTLGAEYTKEQTKFTVWSPYATAMKLNIYAAGEGGEAQSYDMVAGAKGTWTYTLPGDNNGKYYTYTVINSNSSTSSEIVDPYARSGGKNGARGMILDLNSTNPEGWDTQNMPTLASNSEAVIYEAQLRDLTIHESSGVTAANRGKFLGLTETGTVNSYNESTALDYLKELGITQVHFQPLFDFATVDESFKVATYNKYGEYNWGYDPLNYNMPEGSYSSDPSKGEVRVNEMKQMIMALHNAGIQVVMDVVYNHVSNAQSSNFEKLIPGYFFRMTSEGKFFNGSGCGNETASDHYMFRKFMIDSVKYWTEEYKIDGFRFDLMALHDIDTMNAIYDELAEINPDVIIYGEGWTGGDSGLLSSKQAKIDNAKKTPNIAYFNDTVRDGIKGGVFADEDGLLSSCGYVQGVKNSESVIYTAASGGGSKMGSPIQSINYGACHDNSLLWDKLNTSVNDTKDNLKAMNRMAAAAVFTGQGISFIPAGEEMLRSKKTAKDNTYDNRPYAYLTDPNYYFSDNSYKSPDSVNAINWDLLHENAEMVEFYKQLIAIKKAFAQFHYTDSATLKANLVYSDGNTKDGVAVYALKDPNSDEYVVVIFNNNKKAMSVAIPEGEYGVYVNGAQANAEQALSTVTGAEVQIGALSAMVLKGNDVDVENWVYAVSEVNAA